VERLLLGYVDRPVPRWVPAPYTDQFSLQAHPEAEASITTTLFFGLRLARNTQFYFDPEVAGGRGFSGTNGMANSPNGETPRVIVTTPKPYIARLYVTQDFGFGDSMENFNSEERAAGR
jgi:high affinity Mn2+ porin